MSFRLLRTRTIELKRSIRDIFNSGKSENHDENYESQKEETEWDLYRNFAKHVKSKNESKEEEFMLQHYKNFAERVELENNQMFKFIKTCIEKDVKRSLTSNESILIREQFSRCIDYDDVMLIIKKWFRNLL